MDIHNAIEKNYKLSPTQKKALQRLGLVTLRDLLYYFPTRYSHMSHVTTIAQATPGEMVSIYGIAKNPRVGKTFKTKIPSAYMELVDINDDTLSLTWFHQAFLAKKIKDGQSIRITGKISEQKGKKSMLNPELEQVSHMPIDAHESLFQKETNAQEVFGFPIYPESRGITSKWIYHAILKILSSKEFENLEDPLPLFIREKYHLPNIQTALVWLHAAKKQSDADTARKRFAFEEIFLIQLENQLRRMKHEKMHSYQLEANPSLMKSFIESFPFTPTEAQMNALEHIKNDLEHVRPMTRLVEGDVGSGKTFIAAVAAYLTIQNRPRKANGQKQDFGRLQVAYMAPTEVLATQLFENFIQYFKKSNVQIGLLTGSGCRKFPSKIAKEEWTSISRTQLLKWVKNGEIPILIGTHALIQKKVAFQNLALVIIDEQHRFGTKQRMELTTKEQRIPHYLSMTATPIPRTLALTLYGDLDLSVVDQMPSGRKPVQTSIVPDDENKRAEVYEHIRKELENGRQAYVICPRIEEPDPDKQNSLQLKSVTAEARRLKKTEFKDYRIGTLHSKMSKIKKEEVMNQFYKHEIDVLVSTSVIEVGVNVPNATNIIIEGAERFGLAQLHQLRGRVIRSEHQAYCFLFAKTSSSKTTERLEALTQAKNGFELAEIDLTLRGTGDLLGSKQWGVSDLAMEAIKNIKMVEYARTEAEHLVRNDETLENLPELQNILKEKKHRIHFE